VRARAGEYIYGRYRRLVTPKELELLTGMGNCFEACHADFDGTVEMVAGSRELEPADVKELLRQIREHDRADPTYLRLRRRLPSEFDC
jgi:hypothetical protein